MRLALILTILLISINQPLVGADFEPNQIDPNSFPLNLPGGVGQVELNYQYKISFPGKTSQLFLTVELPDDVPNCQKIIYYNYSHEPVEVTRMEHVRIVKFHLKNCRRDAVLKINGRVQIYHYDLIRARQKSIKTNTSAIDNSEFLKAQEYVEVDDPAIKKVVAEIIKGKTDLEKVRNIHQYVVTRLKYVYNKKTNGAAWALKHRRGDCDEYTSLFVALCRAADVPARWIGGQTTSWENTPYHSWVEVYFDQYGWTPFDPTRNNKPYKNYAVLEPIYFYATIVRQNERMKGIHSYVYRYLGDEPKIKRNFTVNNVSMRHFGKRRTRR